MLREEAADGQSAEQLLAGFVSEIALLYPGWSPSTGPSAAPADFEPPDGRFVVAYVDEGPVACGGLKRLDAQAAEIKRLYVRPDLRRHGLGRQMLEALEEIASAGGYGVVRLDTGAEQPEAIRLFQAAGYHQIGDYNRNPFASYWFEKSLR